MDGTSLERLPRFSTISLAEKINISKALVHPLSGYIGGVNSAGYWVTKLQDDWCNTFGCKHAVACNSATSGLLAACMAIGIGPGDTVWTTAYSMSATAACAKVLGARIVFIDIETRRFSINTSLLRGPIPKCIIVTNLFGHPAYLATMRTWCDSNKVWMIEDNAQAPFAKEGGRYAGTIGHIGVFSLNVHKHIQCGEGGVIATDDDALSDALAGCINHGELSSGPVGLNLRMSEPTAAIACAQLARAPGIIENKIVLAHHLTDMMRRIPWIFPQVADAGCVHVYYVWAARLAKDKRDSFVKLLNERGFPMRIGYSKPLNLIFDKSQSAPVAERMEDQDLMTFEICAYDPKVRHLKRMREIVSWAAERVDNEDIG